MRKVLLVITALMVGIAAYSCECKSGVDYFKEADIVFVGEVLDINSDSSKRNDDNNRYFHQVRLKVINVNKGDINKYEIIVVRVHSLYTEACGVEFEAGKLFKIYTKKQPFDNNYWTGLCAGSHKVNVITK